MADYVRPGNKFLLRGMNITLPGDRLGPEWAQLIRNLRSYRIGEWQQRPGLTQVADVDPGAAAAIYFERRITDPTTGLFRRIVGTSDGNVYVDDAAHTTYTQVDTGYDGEPLSSVIVRPDRSPLPYMLIGNGARHSKFDTVGARTNWGLTSPTAEPIAELATPVYKVIDDCDATAGFVATGGALSLQSRVSGTIAQILYDSGTAGWACIAPNAMDDNWQEGLRLSFATNPEVAQIESVYPEIKATTVQAIRYDSGSTGLCTIQPALPTLGLERNMLLQLDTELVRVLSVTEGLDGIPSFRCSTVGTILAGDAITGFRSFRAFLANVHAAGEAISDSYLQIAVAGAGIATLEKTGALDLSATDVGAQRPIQSSDYVHISLRTSDFTQITEMQIQFDVDSGTNDFTQNYYFKSIRQPDLLAAYKQTASSLTAQQQELQRQQIDDYRRQQLEAERAGFMDGSIGIGGMFGGAFEDVRREAIARIDAELSGSFTSSSGQGALSSPGSGGDNQWTELFIPISEFQRVGSDTSRGWKDVAAFQITINATGAVDVGLDALWIGGTYGPDFTMGETYSPAVDIPVTGYKYIYRFRNTQTGSTSGFSPPSRSPILPRRDGISITGDTSYGDTQADVCDYFRIGGTLADWHYVGTAPVGDLTFVDIIPDDVAVRNPIADFNHFQPWVRSDLPKSGTCDVIGTTLVITGGDSLDLDYIKGNQIIVGNRLYSFYSKPLSTTVVELTESAGYQTNIPWQIPDPSMEGQPLPFVFGPYGGSTYGEFVFGLGDDTNPGYLYWTKGNNPEACADTGYLELSNPSEPLVAGGILDGIVYVWSDRRSWRILPSYQGGQTGAGSEFYSQETAMGKGLASRWGLAFGDQIYFVSWDGLYATRGDAVTSLTDESLRPIFRQDGQEISGAPYETLASISFASTDLADLSLTYSKDGLYFLYRGVDLNLYDLYYGFLHQGWVRDFHIDRGPSRIVREDGPQVDNVLYCRDDGILFQYDSTSGTDGVNAIPCGFITREEDFGDTRTQKQLGDFIVDLDNPVNTISTSLQFNNNTSNLALTPISTTVGRERVVKDVETGNGRIIRSVAVSLSWNSVAGLPTKLYEWQPSALLKESNINLRATDWDDGGYKGAKWLQGCRIRANTYNNVKYLTAQYDGGQIADSFSIQHDGELITARAWAPIVCHQMRLIGQNVFPTADWQLFEVEWVWEPEPESVTFWEPQFTSLDLPGFYHIREVLIAHRSTADIEMTVYVDDTFTDVYTIPAGGVGVRDKIYLPLVARKGKLWKFRFTSAEGFALYAKDMEVRAKAWGSADPYQIFRPFGDATRSNGGARI